MNTNNCQSCLGLPQRVLRILPERNRIVAGRITASLDQIRSEPGRLSQIRFSSLSEEYRKLAFNLYASGQPLAEVRRAFAGMALAGLRVAELRGTEKPFLEVVVSVGPGSPDAGVAEPAYPPEARDFSLGNAKANFRYVSAALVSGDSGLAERIAALAGDPPDADWAGPRSTICTPNDQHLAYAVKHLFAGELEPALAELAAVRPTRREAAEIDHPDLVRMLRGILQADAGLFLVSLEGLLLWHEQVAQGDWGDWDFYLSLPGVGLSALAVSRGLVGMADLPESNPYLPLGLIAPMADETRDRVADDLPEFSFHE